MQRNPQTKTKIWSAFPSTLPYQKSFSKEEGGEKKRPLSESFESFSVFSKKRLTNKFINLIMTNGEKEKAFKNLQTTLFHLNQKRVGKGKAVLGTLSLKGEEKKRVYKKELVSGLPLRPHLVKTPLQLPTEYLKDSVFQKGLSFFSSKKKVSQLSLIEVNCSLLSPIENILEFSSNRENKGACSAEVGRKEKGWCLSLKKEKTTLSKEGVKRFKNPFSLEKAGFSLSPVFDQSSLSESEKKGSSTFATPLLPPILFFQQQRVPSIQKIGKREELFLKPKTLSFEDPSLLEGWSWFSSKKATSLSFSPFLRDLGEGSQKRKEREVVCNSYGQKGFSCKEDSPVALLEEKSTFSLPEGKWKKKSKETIPLYLFCRATLSFLPPLWACFKRGKKSLPSSSLSSYGQERQNRQRQLPYSQGGDSFTGSDLPFQKQTTLVQSNTSKEKQRLYGATLSGDTVRKVTRKNQKPKDNSILTAPKEDKSEFALPKYPFHLRVLYKGVSQVRPLIEVRKVRKGGNTFQVPAFVKGGKGDKMGLTWLIEKGREKSLKSPLSFSESLCFNLLQSFEKSGEARQKRDQLLRLALSNRPYSRFRWW